MREVQLQDMPISEDEVFLTLQQERKLLEELNHLSLLKKEALLHDDFECLESIVKQEETCFHQLKVIDAACVSQVRFFCKTATRDEPVLERFRAEQLELGRLAARLQTNNRFNIDLTKDSLALTQFMLSVLTMPADGKTSTYNASGQMVGKQAKKHILDYKG
jgi:flagellar biosynthesis/type III secretory pathway chaperone